MSRIHHHMKTESITSQMLYEVPTLKYPLHLKFVVNFPVLCVWIIMIRGGVEILSAKLDGYYSYYLIKISCVTIIVIKFTILIYDFKI